MDLRPARGPRALIELEVTRAHNGMRLDRFLAEALPQFSRARLQEWIKSGAVTWQGGPARPRCGSAHTPTS